MKVSKIAEAMAVEVKPGRTRRILHTDHLMMVVFEFADGPAAKPDAPHTHPHEQVTYVAEGEVQFFIGEESRRLAPGDDELAVAHDQPDLEGLLDESSVFVSPAEQRLHLRARGQGHPLDFTFAAQVIEIMRDVVDVVGNDTDDGAIDKSTVTIVGGGPGNGAAVVVGTGRRWRGIPPRYWRTSKTSTSPWRKQRRTTAS